MEDRKKTVAAITLIVVFVFFVVLIGVIFIARKKPIVSPVPEGSAIRIIFVSPTTTPPAKSREAGSGFAGQDLASPETPTPTPKPKATATPKPRETATPTPTKAASPSATPKP